MTAPSVGLGAMTTCFAQVVVPTDFSSLSWQVLTLADLIAGEFGVPRRLVHVDTASPWSTDGVGTVVLEDAPTGDPFSVDVIAARTATEGILRVLGDDEGSLLVMSTHGHTGAVELATGSTTKALLRRWHGPMVLAGPKFQMPAIPFRRVVLCIDPSSRVPPADLAADAVAWAATFDVPLEVLAVMDPNPPLDFERLITQQERLEAAVAALSDENRLAKLVRLSGNRPGTEIARYADSVKGTLVALSTHARRPATHALLGSTAMTVLRHTASPALVRRIPMR